MTRAEDVTAQLRAELTVERELVANLTSERDRLAELVRLHRATITTGGPPVPTRRGLAPSPGTSP